MEGGKFFSSLDLTSKVLFVLIVVVLVFSFVVRYVSFQASYREMFAGNNVSAGVSSGEQYVLRDGLPEGFEFVSSGFEADFSGNLVMAVYYNKSGVSYVLYVVEQPGDYYERYVRGGAFNVSSVSDNVVSGTSSGGGYFYAWLHDKSLLILKSNTPDNNFLVLKYFILNHFPPTGALNL